MFPTLAFEAMQAMDSGCLMSICVLWLSSV